MVRIRKTNGVIYQKHADMNILSDESRHWQDAQAAGAADVLTALRAPREGPSTLAARGPTRARTHARTID